jgi:hypothetical protein
MGKHTEKADIWLINMRTSEWEQIVKRILNNKYSFKARCWKCMSPKAKEFI